MKNIYGLLFTILISIMGLSSCSEKKDANVLRYALAEEPPSLNSLTSTDTVSFFILGHIMEGLTRYGKTNEIEAAVAESWEMAGTKATFKLRSDAKWSDGKAVTAQDFVFSWRLVVNPKTASEYAYIMYSIKNAKAINEGKMKPEDLGVKALDAHTLEVTLERPTPYFLALTSFGTLLPVREDVYNAHSDAYAAEATNMIYNGPFKLTKWEHSKSLRMEKNEHYWNAKEVSLAAIDVPYITSDTKARFNLFRDNKIDFVELNGDLLSEAVKSNYKIKKFSTGAVYYLQFNFANKRITANANFRKAMQSVMNTTELVNKVVATPGDIPGASVFPTWLKGVNGLFRDEYPEEPTMPDYAAAKKYIELARKELGKKDLTLVYLCGDSPTASKQAEYFQNLFKEKLGIDIKIDKQTFKQRLAKMTSGDFDIVAAGWGPDYDDPMTFGDLFSSWSDNNHGRYKSAAYDSAVKIAQNSMDPKTRMAAFATMQRLLKADAVVLPTYEAGSVYLQSKRVNGILRSVLGADPVFRYAKVKD